MTVCRSEGMPLDSNFGFYRYRMSELQNSYRTSRFIRFPDTREFRYNRKYDDAVRSFFLDIFELAAEHKNYYLFRRLYFNHDELSLNILRRFSRGISRLYKKAVCRIRLRFMHVPYPAVKRIYPVHLHSVFHGIIRDIIKPLSFESRTYAESVYYRAAETSLFYSLVYEVYLNEREHYMKLFPAEQLSHVLDAIGLFDSMFKVFCDNTARKQLIDNEHARITGELEAMEKELESLKNSRRELRDDFRNRTAELTLPGEYVSRHSELFTTYITEEEKISRTVASMEHSLERYREECGILKKEKDLLRIQYGEKLEKMYREVEELKSKSILEQQRFRSEIKKMTYDKGKSDLEIIDLRAEITHLKHEIESMTNQYSMTAQKAEGSSGELKKLREKYEKVLAELSGIQKKFNDMTNMLREGLGPYAKDFSSEELNKETRNLLKSSETYRDASAAVKLLQEQQKNDKRSLMLNANLISRLKEQVDKLEVQLQYLRDTTSSDREKELEEENERLADIIRKSGL